MRPQLAAWTAILLTDAVAAIPTVSFPINSQVPPVARIGQPFSFVFSPSTFASNSPLTYTLVNAPKWLSIDSSDRRIYGTPRDGDIAPGEVVGVPVNLVATDQTGSTTHDATLVVSRNRGPKVEIPLEKQIPDFGVFSSPYSVLSGPDTPFSFALDQKTFSSASNNRLGYYAVMADNTPLPAWISFDSNKPSFSGRTPPLDSLIQPPQRFAFHLVASDVAGFAGAALEFDIVVRVHQISAEETTIILTAAPGKPASYTRLKGMVKLDGKQPNPGEVTLSTSRDMPTWLSVDKDSWDITGTPSEKSSSTNFTITFQDGFSDSLNITVLVDVEDQATKAAGVFKESLPTLTATPGQHFSFDFWPHLVNPSDTEMSVAQDDSASWIRFDSDQKILSGDPPSIPEDTVAVLEVQAKLKSTNKSDKLAVKLLIRVAAHSTPTSETPSDVDPTPPGELLPVGGYAAPGGKVDVVLLSWVLPVTIMCAFIVAFAVFRCYRRHKAKQRPRLTTRDISGSLPGSFVITSNGPSAPPSLPDITHNFGRNFTVGDVFTPEKETYVESRSSFLTKGTAPPSMATVKLLTPSVRSKHGGASGRMPFLGGGSFGAIRLGNSLASISERSVNDEAGDMDARTAGLLGNKTIGSFRNGIEINIPSLQGTPRSRYTGSPDSRYEAHRMASPRSRSSSADSDPETFSLRAESRLAHYGPPEIGRRFMWPWFRGNNSRSRSSKLHWGSTRTHSKQPSTSTVDTFAYKRTGQSIRLGYANAGASPEITPPPRARLLGAVPLARPVTRRDPTDASLEGMMIFSQGQSEMSIPMNAPPTTPGGPSAPSIASQEDISMASLPNWRDSPDDLLGFSYEDLVKNSPFHPSATWQTIFTTDEWVDETVQSMDTPQREVAKKEVGTPSGRAVLQDSPSPVSIGPGDVSTRRRASSPAGNEKREQPLAADVPTSSTTQPSNVKESGSMRSFQQDQSGLPKSHSNGVSPMSGKSRGEESDFAVYI